MLRPYTVNRPDTGQTIITYLNPTQLQTQAKIDASGRYTNRYDQIDGLGRLERTAVFNAEAPNVWDQQDYCYNPQGGQTFVTYTYQGTGWAVDKACSVKNGVISSTQPGDTTSFDVLGRPTLVTHSDGKTIQYGYKNRATSVTDESNGSSNVERIYQTDGLGRVVSVCEVSSALLGGNGGSPVDCGQDIAGTGFLTTYEYDLLDNLSVVRQTGLFARVYNHDSLSRLTSESSPEAFNDVTSYTYNPSGMVTQRVRPAPNQLNPGQTVSTTYTYDALGRPTDITYSDGATPNVHNLYDVSNSYGVTEQNPIGRLVSSQTGENNYNTLRIYSYDPMGRILNNWQCTPRVCSYLLSYTYDLLGNMTSSTNGVGGVTLNYAYNGAPRITGITSTLSDATHPSVLLSGVKYGTAGPTASSLGDGIAETRTYDPRLGLQSYKAGSVYSYTLTKAPNGNITGGNDSANGAWSYSYDPFNRLATAGKTDQAFAYDYDRFGNRWKQRLTSAGSSTQQPSYTFDGYNHITNSGFAYDALGNVTNDGTHSYTYDAENRLIQVDGGATAYTYDAEGRRVRAATVGGPTLEFLFDLNGKAITKLNGNNGNWAAGEIYAGGQHIATYANNTTYFHHQDWLGAKRVSTDPTGAVVETCTNLPFGDGGSCTGTNASLISFTDFDHDSESNLEHAWFRQLSRTQGRWMTPDPYGGSMDLGNPQSLNRYAYVGNDPVNATDPLGLCYHTVTSQDAEGNVYVDCADPLEGSGGGGGHSTPGLDQPGETGSGGMPDLSQVLDTTMRWLSAPRNQNCMNALAAAGSVVGAGAGAQAGAGIGATAGAAGGTLVVPGVGTIGGAAAGAVGGGLAGGIVGGGIGAVGGGIVGWALCAQGGEGGGSSPDATTHGAERLEERGFSEQDVAETKTGLRLTQADGATVYVKKVGDGSYNVIVEGAQGIITGMKNLSRNQLNNLSANYGWH